MHVHVMVIKQLDIWPHVMHFLYKVYAGGYRYTIIH